MDSGRRRHHLRTQTFGAQASTGLARAAEVGLGAQPKRRSPSAPHPRGPGPSGLRWPGVTAMARPGGDCVRDSSRSMWSLSSGHSRRPQSSGGCKIRSLVGPCDLPARATGHFAPSPGCCRLRCGARWRIGAPMRSEAARMGLPSFCGLVRLRLGARLRVWCGVCAGRLSQAGQPLEGTEVPVLFGDPSGAGPWRRRPGPPTLNLGGPGQPRALRRAMSWFHCL